MNNISSESAHDKGSRGPLVAAIKDSLRELGVQLSLLNHRVGGRLDLRGVDLDCLNLIHRHGPVSPSGLARQAGLHPATVTGIVDRLERDGWVVRERGTADRRAVLVRALPDRNPELFGLLKGMNTSMNELLRDYDRAELELLADFLERTAQAGREATEELGGE